MKSTDFLIQSEPTVTTNAQHTEIAQIPEIAETCPAPNCVHFLPLYHTLFYFQIK